MVKIPSPSGSERQTAKFISSYLGRHGIATYFDSAAKRMQTDSGNLIAELKGSGPTIMFLAHMDTVERGDVKIKPIIKNGKITSDGSTILGVDNKASVVALMAALTEIKKEKKHPNVIAAFTASEEGGVMGATYLTTKNKPDHTFVIDGSTPTGTFISSALGDTIFEIRIHGKSMHVAHAEKGINAMKAAGIIIARQRLGKYADERYVNIARVEGGDKDNIIPGEVSLMGEARALTQKKMDKLLVEIEKNAKAACSMTGCTYEFVVNKKESLPPYHISNGSKIIKIAKRASKLAGLRFDLLQVKGTMETNVLQRNIGSLIGVSRGGKMPHSKSESVTAKEIDDLKRLIIAISHAANGA